MKKYIITANDVVDNLNSTLPAAPLSANQGRVLNQSKVAKNQGTQYAGKVLGIGDDGIVTPVEGGSGGLFIITATCGPNGMISPIGRSGLEAGNSITYTITPNSGCVVENVLVDGVSVGRVNSYTFENVQDKHTIDVTFNMSPKYTMIIPSGSSSSISKNIQYADLAADMSETDRDNLIKSHTKFAVVHYSGGKPQVNYWLYRNNLNYRATDETCDISSGVSSNLTGTDGDVMVLYDRVWWQVTKSGSSWKISFTWVDPTESSQPGTWVCPHHYGNSLSSTTYAKYVGMGVFAGVYWTPGVIRSANVVDAPTGGYSHNTLYSMMTYGRNWQFNHVLPMTWAWYVICLYFVKGNRNCQAAYGNGIVGAQGIQSVNKDWSASNAWINGTTSNQTTGVTALGVHNPWGNAYTFLGETRMDGNVMKISVLGGGDHQNIETGAASTWKSITVSTTPGVITDITGTEEYPFFASAASGTDYSTYYADQFYANSGATRCVVISGAYNYALAAGPLYVDYGNVDATGATLCSRLHVLIT